MTREQLLKGICAFIIEANQHGYAAGDQIAKVKEADHSTTIAYENGDWKYHDNYFGGEPYGGREVVFYQGKPVWMMVYYGQVNQGNDLKKVYAFLQEALRAIPEDNPFRGPRSHISENKELEYVNNWTGNASSFSGTEKIFLNEDQIYEASYLGGLVDQRGE